MGIFQSVVESNPEMNFIGNWRGRFEMAVPASFLFHDSNLSLFSPQILPYKIMCRLLDWNKKYINLICFLFFCLFDQADFSSGLEEYAEDIVSLA